MIRKHSSQKGPGWTEVGLAALLSVLVGVVLGAVLLMMKPVTTVKEIPTKDVAPGTVFYIDGSHNSALTPLVAAKRKDFVAGQSVSLSEEEVNTLFPPKPAPPPPPKPKPGDKTPPPAPDEKMIDQSPLSVRIHGGTMQFANTVIYDFWGTTGSIIVQARGEFGRRGSTFVFVPEVFYVGGCPFQRVPVVRDWLLKKLLFSQPVPDDVAAAWSKLVDVSIDGNTLRLKAP